MPGRAISQLCATRGVNKTITWRNRGGGSRAV